jgi:hypothetical protein
MFILIFLNIILVIVFMIKVVVSTVIVFSVRVSRESKVADLFGW